jgi:signal peptidase I
MSSNSETNIVDTLQSLTVAFALAMTVRSFVTEGFVIPTGSMAPTLLGAHSTIRSPETGYEYAFDYAPLAAERRAAAERGRPVATVSLVDPMVNPVVPVFAESANLLKEQMGDRVLVLKFLYLIQNPKRWDVVVFKNPSDPVGEFQNYIKRLVGLPDEQLLTVDGDIWTAPIGAPLSEFRVQRKPEHVQRAVWQPVHDADYAPIDPAGASTRMRRQYDGPPWIGKGWDVSTPAYRCDSAEPSTLSWRASLMPIDDRSPYNALRNAVPYSVSDIRVATAIEADDPAALSTELAIHARSHTFAWSIAGGKATLRITHRASGQELSSVELPLAAPPAGSPFALEFWHVDQTMSLWLNGTEVATLPYDQWTVEDRVRFAYPDLSPETYRVDPVTRQPESPMIAWSFSGSPVALHRLRVDRDLYYRPAITTAGEQFLSNGPPIVGLGFGSDIAKPAQLGEDQFLMMGDNSAFSKDGRIWGRPHALVQRQLGMDAAFVVPRELLLGPAWSVYFPAPLTHAAKRDLAVVPNFGSLRFIR